MNGTALGEEAGFPALVDEALLRRIEFFTGEHGGQKTILARVEIGLRGAGIEEAVLKIVLPWTRDFRELMPLIHSIEQGMSQVLAQGTGNA